MTKQSSFDKVEYVDSKSDDWGNKDIVNAMMPLILDRLRKKAGTPLVITRGAHIKGHNPNGDHPKGWGADIYFPKLAFLNAVNIVEDFLLSEENSIYGFLLDDLCSLGIYPDWKPVGGFHLGFRGHKARWGRIDNKDYMDQHYPDRKHNYVSLGTALNYFNSIGV